MWEMKTVVTMQSAGAARSMFISNILTHHSNMTVRYDRLGTVVVAGLNSAGTGGQDAATMLSTGMAGSAASSNITYNC